MELRIGSQGPAVTIGIAEPQLQQNQSMAKDTIVFAAEYEWGATSECLSEVEQHLRSKDIEVRLLRSNVPITQWFGVSVYDVDQWIPA